MNAQQKNWLIVVVGMILILAVTIVVFMQLRTDKVVNNFEECRDAGGAILESYPEQCLIDGKTYPNEAQRPVMPESDYVGLSEDEAIAKAKQSNVPARVVERDDEALPVTMDFVFGRHNLHVREGKVYKVEIEGQATDSQADAE